MSDATGTGPQGVLTTLTGGGYTAQIAGVGASLRALAGPDGRELVLSSPVGGLRVDCRGAVLAPWPNRLEDGVYEFGGVSHRLALSEPERGNAAHGLVLWERWTPGPVTGDRDRQGVTFSLDLVPRPGYPFELHLEAEYVLDAGGLHWAVRARNEGAGPAPYAVAGHPYLTAGPGVPGAVDDWTLRVPAGRYLEVDPERLLPVAEHAVGGTRFDLRAGRALAGQVFDHAFTGLVRGPDGWGRVELRGPGGRGVALGFDAGTRWVQVYTDDQAGPGRGRRGVAVEPMTAPANALRTGRDLVVLGPGEEHTARWTIGALE